MAVGCFQCFVSDTTTTELRIIVRLKLGGGIFTVKMPFFSGKTAENVMGVYGFDCPAIF